MINEPNELELSELNINISINQSIRLEFLQIHTHTLIGLWIGRNNETITDQTMVYI